MSFPTWLSVVGSQVACRLPVNESVFPPQKKNRGLARIAKTGARRRAAQPSPGLRPGKTDHTKIERPRRRPPQQSRLRSLDFVATAFAAALNLPRFDSPGGAPMALT